MSKLKNRDHPCYQLFPFNDANPITKNSIQNDLFTLHTRLNKPKTNPSIKSHLIVVVVVSDSIIIIIEREKERERERHPNTIK